MRLLNRVLACAAVLAGLALVGWAPAVLSVLTRQALPAPVASDPSAMIVWSGVAFARVCGAVLAGLGAVLYASNAAVFRPRAVTVALFAGSLLATAIAISQEVAIWAAGIGWLLAMLFACVSVATGLQLLRAPRLDAERIA